MSALVYSNRTTFFAIKKNNNFGIGANSCLGGVSSLEAGKTLTASEKVTCWQVSKPASALKIVVSGGLLFRAARLIRGHKCST